MANDGPAVRRPGLPRRLLVFAAAALAVFIAAAPWPFAWASLAPPAVTLAIVFDFSLRRPDAFPPISAFALGVLLDVLSGPVFGLGALTAVAVHFAAAGQRRFLSPRGIAHAWLGLALAAIAIAAVSWIIASAYRSAVQPFGPSLAQAALTAAAYPLAALAMGGVRKALGLSGRPA